MAVYRQPPYIQPALVCVAALFAVSAQVDNPPLRQPVLQAAHAALYSPVPYATQKLPAFNALFGPLDSPQIQKPDTSASYFRTPVPYPLQLSFIYGTQSPPDEPPLPNKGRSRPQSITTVPNQLSPLSPSLYTGIQVDNPPVSIAQQQYITQPQGAVPRSLSLSQALYLPPAAPDSPPLGLLNTLASYARPPVLYPSQLQLNYGVFSPAIVPVIPVPQDVNSSIRIPHKEAKKRAHSSIYTIQEKANRELVKIYEKTHEVLAEVAPIEISIPEPITKPTEVRVTVPLPPSTTFALPPMPPAQDHIIVEAIQPEAIALPATPPAEAPVITQTISLTDDMDDEDAIEAILAIIHAGEA